MKINRDIYLKKSFKDSWFNSIINDAITVPEYDINTGLANAMVRHGVEFNSGIRWDLIPQLLTMHPCLTKTNINVYEEPIELTNPITKEKYHIYLPITFIHVELDIEDYNGELEVFMECLGGDTLFYKDN